MRKVRESVPTSAWQVQGCTYSTAGQVKLQQVSIVHTTVVHIHSSSNSLWKWVVKDQLDTFIRKAGLDYLKNCPAPVFRPVGEWMVCVVGDSRGVAATT